MTATIFHKLYGEIKRITPAFIHKFLRSFFTAIFTPIRFSIKKGHFISSMKVKALDRFGKPIPWYTYPCVDFLKFRTFDQLNILEFGAGQSTLWWGERAAKVFSFEGNEGWYNYLKTRMPRNVSLNLASADHAATCLTDVDIVLSKDPSMQFDLVIIDGLWRTELVDAAKKFLKRDGAIICDNSEGYGFYEKFSQDKEFQKVDFYGFAAGVILQSCTTIYFKENCFLFKPNIPTFDVEKF